MKLEPFSPKQLRAMCWWCPGSPDAGRDAVICDGAVRSGKTLCLGIGFAAWASRSFHGQAFAFCGRTIRSLKRNLLNTLLPALRQAGFGCAVYQSENWMELSYAGRKNRFYFFGGKDEGSAALIQGMTLAGVLLDEVALMPRSFVEQALARCSVDGSKFWFNCNPEHPQHWFYQEWILQSQQKNALYLHFTMQDNPALSPEVIARYEQLYSGAFYERFIRGRWVAAQGLVYPFLTRAMLCEAPANLEEFRVSCDYGTVNPASFGLACGTGSTSITMIPAGREHRGRTKNTMRGWWNSAAAAGSSAWWPTPLRQALWRRSGGMGPTGSCRRKTTYWTASGA